MAHTVTSYYVSQDVTEAGQALASWSVYSEQFMPEALDEGDPIDGSQRVVSTHPTQHEAQAEADRLWKGRPGDFEYQVCGVTPETEDMEEFPWVTGEVHESLSSARGQVERIKAKRPQDQVWIERRSTRWEKVE